MNSHRKGMMTTQRTAYELLSNKSKNAVEKHYSSSKIEVSETQKHLMTVYNNRIEHFNQ